MARWLPAAFVALVFVGCLSDERLPDPDAPAPGEPTTIETTYWLAADYSLSATPPSAEASVPVASGTNPYVNEDLTVFSSPATQVDASMEAARLVLLYEVTEPVAVPFPNQSEPEDARLWILWLGINRTFSAYTQTFDAPFLVPGEVYRAEADWAIPAGGLRLGLGRTVDLLIGSTATNDGDALRVLVGPGDMGSRIETRATTIPQRTDLGPVETAVDETIVIPGNSGAFTGATAGENSEYRRALDLPEGTAWLRIEVEFHSTVGPKSDLDLWLYGPDGSEVATSTTPYQSEAIELWGENLAASSFSGGSLLVNAYSGANTEFQLRIFFANGPSTSA